MAPNQIVTDSLIRSSRARLGAFLYLAVLIALIVPGIAFGQDATDTINTTCTFASNINKILNAISIVVVTIAVVFSGYQIAFAHKRIGDVAPVLIGAVLIGAAGQIAKMFLSSSTSSAGATACQTTSLISHVLSNYA
ncbi:TrbC/VirB2 family protein [Rhodanobacter hydrolyticus]|uniref:TrbC/VirB2 family protein n=1 Tax=Rhodanobacter hydrolyticus TaxID=2250595 RepID=A0ABW8J5G3_9GAMM